MKIITLICLVCFAALGGCQHEAVNSNDVNTDPTLTESCDEDTVYFVNDVFPVLINNCTTSNCHDAVSPKEGVNLTSYNSIISTSEVRTGSHTQSKLYKVLVDDGEDRMPPSAALSSSDISAIATWIDQGAKNNQCTESTECNSVNVSFSSTVLSITQSNCAGCHNAATPSGNITLSNYTNISTVATSGQLLGAIKRQSGYQPMPPSYSLTPCQIEQIESWINGGKFNN
jgi:mono/diheme cytochrome c family protein